LQLAANKAPSRIFSKQSNRHSLQHTVLKE
jgi:hypothetical protein